MSHLTHHCPVCGYSGLQEPPVSAISGGGSYEICPSCGFQFGVTDDDEGYSFLEWRKKWVSEGMRWSSISLVSPDNWDPLGILQPFLPSGTAE